MRRTRQVLLAGTTSIAALAAWSCATTYGGTEEAPVEAGAETSQDAMEPDVAVVPEDAALDGDADADPVADADTDAGACDLTKPFGPALPLEGAVNSTEYEEFARISPNGLELLVTRPSAGHARIFVSTRADVTSAWGVPALVGGLIPAGTAATKVDMTGATLTGDGLSLYYAMTIDDGSSWRLWRATRASLGSDWAQPAQVFVGDAALVDTSADVPFVNSSGASLYFVRVAEGKPKVATRVDGGLAFAPFTDLGFVGGVSGLAVSPDERTAYVGLLTQLDASVYVSSIAMASRANPGMPFGVPTVVDGGPNAVGAETVPTWLSQDGCVMLLHSTRAGGLGNGDIYYAKRPK